jgi:hypothetical protein
MRHGRRSRSVRVDGYKRHVLHDLDTGLIRVVGITPANVPEASVTEAISEDLERQEVSLKELHIDRAYLSSHLVRERSDDLEVYCKAWPVREGKRFSKQTFTLDWEQQMDLTQFWMAEEEKFNTESKCPYMSIEVITTKNRFLRYI